MLARRFSPDELKACIRDRLEEGANVCEPLGRTEEIVGAFLNLDLSWGARGSA